MKILAIGSATQDVFLMDHDDFTTARLGKKTIFSRLTLGAKVKIDSAIQTTGGGGTNAATTFARAGFDTTFVGSIGDDLAGKAVIEALSREGIDTKLVRVRKNEGTGYSVLLLAPNGERTALVVKGASKTFAGIDFEGIITKEKPDWLYITTLSGDMASLRNIVRTARSIGVRIFFNPGDSEIDKTKELLPILGEIDILSVNTDEAERLLKNTKGSFGSLSRGNWLRYLNKGGTFGINARGCPGETEDNPGKGEVSSVNLTNKAICDTMKSHGGVIVSNGAKGAYFTTGDKLYKVGLYTTDKSVDRTGAGDAFGSGFLAEYIRSGGDIEKSLVLASATSSSVVMHVGAKEGILSARAKLRYMPVEMKDLKERKK